MVQFSAVGGGRGLFVVSPAVVVAAASGDRVVESIEEDGM